MRNAGACAVLDREGHCPRIARRQTQRENRGSGRVPARRSRRTSFSRRDEAEPIAVSATRARVRVFQLRNAFHVECFERAGGDWRRSFDSRDRATRRNSINATAPQEQGNVGTDTRAGAAGGGSTNRPQPGWAGFVFARTAMARPTATSKRECCGPWGENGNSCKNSRANRNHSCGRSALPILRARKSLRERTEATAHFQSEEKIDSNVWRKIIGRGRSIAASEFGPRTH